MPSSCKNPLCTLSQALGVIGGKWKPVIIYQLSKSTKRFGQLHTNVVGISRKVLTTQLNELVEDGLVIRESFAELPPRVGYSLAQKGEELLPIFQNIADWGMYLVEDYKKESA